MMATAAGGHRDLEMGGARKGVVDRQDSFDFLVPLHSQRVNSGLVNGGKGRGPVDSRCELEGGSSALWKASHKADDPPHETEEGTAVVHRGRVETHLEPQPAYGMRAAACA